MVQDNAAPIVLPLTNARTTLDLVGGKGASLAQLAAAGFPVPPGFHITTAAYQRLVRGTIPGAIVHAIQHAYIQLGADEMVNGSYAGMTCCLYKLVQSLPCRNQQQSRHVNLPDVGRDTTPPSRVL